MSRRLDLFIALFALVRASFAADPPIVITGHQTVPETGLPAARGVANIQVLRASRAAPELTDQNGWTYHHHVDMACWKGRLYVGWNTCEKDEDVWPSRQLYATSADSVDWSAPADLFPSDISMAQRMYFFHSPAGRMLAVTAFRSTKDIVTERMKGAMIVREIRADHSLGDVFMLRPPSDVTSSQPPSYRESTDAAFVRACDDLLANVPFLEQADYGLCAGERKMKWHDSSSWPADEPSRPHFDKRFGKAMAFYHRRDGALVAVMKWGWVLVSRDEGKTWSSPTRPPTLVAGMAKTWPQRVAEDRYVLFYNPDLANRYPLVMVSGVDGITFGDMRIVHGDLPRQRYEGLYKSIGPQYVRGISEWSTDRSRSDDAMWIAYSMSKEDIWVSRIALHPAATDWNLYSPRWAPATVITHDGEPVVRLEDRDPSDVAKALRFIEIEKPSDISFDIQRVRGDEPLIVEVLDAGGEVLETKTLTTAIGDWRRFTVQSGAARHISFRTGERRIIPPTQQDRPTDSSSFLIRRLTMGG